MGVRDENDRYKVRKKRLFCHGYWQEQGWISNKMSAFYENSVFGKANLPCIVIKVRFSFVARFLFLGSC